MNVRSQKKIAAKIMKVGLSRVKISQEKGVEEAITRNDIKALIEKGLITKVRKRGPRRTEAKKRLKQKGKGRRKGHGSRKGSLGARKSRKTQWIEKVRPMRMLLKELKNSGKLGVRDYRKLYRMVKGGSFRNKKHLLYYVKEHDLLKTPKEIKTEKKTKK